MSWQCVELEVAALFRGLCSPPWGVVEDSIFRAANYRKGQSMERYYERMARLPSRQKLRADGRRRAAEARTRVESIRYCKVCSKPFDFTTRDRWLGDRRRLATCSQQCKHVASGRHELVKINGRSNTIKGWCVALGIADTTVGHRIRKLGWDVRRALTTPSAGRGRGAAAKLAAKAVAA